MTEAEIIEQITKKQNELEEKRSGNAGANIIKALEDEINSLQVDLSQVEKRPSEQQVFLDECAG